MSLLLLLLLLRRFLHSARHVVQELTLKCCTRGIFGRAFRSSTIKIPLPTGEAAGANSETSKFRARCMVLLVEGSSSFSFSLHLCNGQAQQNGWIHLHGIGW